LGRTGGCGILRRLDDNSLEEASVADCKNFEKNMARCNCTYEPCSRKGICCECLTYHQRMGELPACYFSAAVERTYDRSIGAFVRAQKR
jgi:hypothetical protein